MQRPRGFWDERFAEAGWAYGDEPNDFVRESAPRIPSGPVLCLAEGQGRNAVHLAALGHAVTAMDQSAVGMERARELARERGVSLTTVVADLAEFVIEPGRWQGIVSVFAHLPPVLRRRVHAVVTAGLAPGGVFVLEAYAPRQLEFRTGGPDDPERLAPVETLRDELPGLEFEVAREVERDVVEGRYHVGRAATVQILARRPRA
jgi:SAM-dependent methyltransferase